MAGRLSSRLGAVEKRYHIRPPDTGVIETHFPGAWPVCRENTHSITYERCSEHADCGFSSNRMSGNLRRVVVCNGPWTDPPPSG